MFWTGHVWIIFCQIQKMFRAIFHLPSFFAFSCTIINQHQSTPNLVLQTTKKLWEYNEHSHPSASKLFLVFCKVQSWWNNVKLYRSVVHTEKCNLIYSSTSILMLLWISDLGSGEVNVLVIISHQLKLECIDCVFLILDSSESTWTIRGTVSGLNLYKTLFLILPSYKNLWSYLI